MLKKLRKFNKLLKQPKRAGYTPGVHFKPLGRAKEMIEQYNIPERDRNRYQMVG